MNYKKTVGQGEGTDVVTDIKPGGEAGHPPKEKTVNNQKRAPSQPDPARTPRVV